MWVKNKETVVITLSGVTTKVRYGCIVKRHWIQKMFAGRGGLSKLLNYKATLGLFSDYIGMCY